MLVPQGSEPSLFGDHPLVLLERLANCASSNLGVLVVPVVFYNQNTTTDQYQKDTIREELTPGGSRHCLELKIADKAIEGKLESEWGKVRDVYG
jgi:hypothetical protein